jgi:20S proteasome subunit alpha 6
VNRRIVINAEIVDSLKVFRKEHRIEVTLTFETDGDGQPKGILVGSTFPVLLFHWLKAISQVEAMSSPKTYVPLQLSSDVSNSDSLVPPFTEASSSSKLVLLVHLDPDNPIPEEKWVKSGDLQEWLRTMFGPLFWTTSDSDGWGKKIEVIDPEPVRIRML